MLQEPVPRNVSLTNLKDISQRGVLSHGREQQVAEGYKAGINDLALDRGEARGIVLNNCSPKGYPGLAQVGNMGLQSKILR